MTDMVGNRAKIRRQKRNIAARATRWTRDTPRLLTMTLLLFVPQLSFPSEPPRSTLFLSRFVSDYHTLSCHSAEGVRVNPLALSFPNPTNPRNESAKLLHRGSPVEISALFRTSLRRGPRCASPPEQRWKTKNRKQYLPFPPPPVSPSVTHEKEKEQKKRKTRGKGRRIPWKRVDNK